VDGALARKGSLFIFRPSPACPLLEISKETDRAKDCSSSWRQPLKVVRSLLQVIFSARGGSRVAHIQVPDRLPLKPGGLDARSAPSGGKRTVAQVPDAFGPGPISSEPRSLTGKAGC
jgi:hypothetical protein